MKYDLISIGDSTHDTFMQVDEASIHCDVKPDKCLLCLSWADKVPISKVSQVPGVGNSANAVVGAARLGLKTAIYTNVGDDVVGTSIKEVFKAEKVSNEFIVTHTNTPSNYSVVLNYGAERTILVHHEPWKYNLPKGLDSDWFYYSSLGPSHSKLHKQIVAYAKRGVKIAFQPGTHQLREGKKKLASILSVSEILLLNKEEAQLLTGAKTNSPRKLLRALLSLGTKIVVMTDGEKGAYTCSKEEAYFVESFPLKAKERTGAGDGFSIGFVSAYMKEKSINEALLWGNANATSVVQYVGAQKGLLTESGITKLIKKYKKVIPSKL